MNINRAPIREALESFALEASGVVVGPPGVGKTYLLLEVVRRLEEQSVPALLLPIDQLGDGTDDDIRRNLNLTVDLIEKIRIESTSYPGKRILVFFDAFDAARNEHVQRRFMSLIRRVVRELRDICNVIVSVRAYDAKKSIELLDLFGKPLPQDPVSYRDPTMPCRNFVIPLLGRVELEQAFAQIASLATVYDGAPDDFRQLLRIPFNLWLFESLVQSVDLTTLTQLVSQVQLLDLFWQRRVSGRFDGDERQVLLTQVARRMVESATLSVRKEEVYQASIDQVFRDLLSDEVLKELPPFAQQLSFFHNILFDYAVSVLLIEDTAERLVEFVTRDASRPIFLRPSLTYFFARFWHDQPAVFWRIYWSLLTTEDSAVRTILNLIPSTVIATEARQSTQLQPILDALAKNQAPAGQATQRLLQALRALEIPRDGLWAPFLAQVSAQLGPLFAWEVALVVSAILKRAAEPGPSSSELRAACGTVSRNLLNWIWSQRNLGKRTWLDALGGSLGVRHVVQTFDSDVAASIATLAPIFTLTEETGFPINYLFYLTDGLKNIWPYAPDFAGRCYDVVFGHHETTNELTEFGTPVLPMTSTRRQDFDMCRHALVEHFPNFLQSSPTVAMRAGINAIDNYIFEDHVLKYFGELTDLASRIETFQFHGGSARYISDGSNIWDGSPVPDETMQIADALYSFISTQAVADANSLRGSLEELRKGARVAFFWKRLLQTAAAHPTIFVPFVLDLSLARPVQTGPETIRELGVFIEAAARVFTHTQLADIESSLVSLPRTAKDRQEAKSLVYCRNRLLARIPQDLLQTPEGRRVAERLERTGKAPSNEPLFRTATWSEAYTEEKWLQERGVDLTRPANKLLYDFFPMLDTFTQDWANKSPTGEAVQTVLPVANALLEKLQDVSVADRAIVDSAWIKLGESARTMAQGVKDLDEAAFLFARRVLLLCSKQSTPELHDEYDKNYKSPAWGPGARNEAARGLLLLGSRRTDTEMLEAVERLVSDPKPEVRFLTAWQLFRIAKTAPERFWLLAERIAMQESNKAVLRGFIETLAHVVVDNEAPAVTVLQQLIQRLPIEEVTGSSESLIPLLVWLALVRKNLWAVSTVRGFLVQPLHYSDTLTKVTFAALGYATPIQLQSPEGRALLESTIEWLKDIIAAAQRAIKEALLAPGGPTSEQQERVRNLFRVIDEVVTRIYFTIGKEDASTSNGAPSIQPEEVRSFYYLVKPLLEDILSFDVEDAKQKGLMLAPTAHHFMKLLNSTLEYDPRGVLKMAADVARSSRSTGYNLDSLAIREVVALVERVLASYRVEAREGTSLDNLLSLLQIFVEAGWPEAIRLVWRLDEVFR